MKTGLVVKSPSHIKYPCEWVEMFPVTHLEIKKLAKIDKTDRTYSEIVGDGRSTQCPILVKLKVAQSMGIME